MFTERMNYDYDRFKSVCYILCDTGYKFNIEFYLLNIGKNIWMGKYKKKNDPELYEVPESEIFDIDYEWQFKIAEELYKLKKKIK